MPQCNTFSLKGPECNSFTIHIQRRKTHEPAESSPTAEKKNPHDMAKRNEQTESAHTVQQLIGRGATAAEPED